VSAHRRPRPILEGIEHGTYTGYNKGCGCEPCREACRAYHQARRNGEPRPRKPRRPTAAQRQAFQGAPYDPAKAAAARRDRSRAPLTDAERAVLAELLGERAS
jgi:hypothetical protein